MANELNAFRTKLSGGGARANQFKVVMNFPAGMSTISTGDTGPSKEMEYLCQAASLPGMVIGEVTVPFRGRNLFLAGDRTFEAWTVTIINDTDFLIRNAFEIWMDEINAMTDNTGIDLPSGYQSSASVQQLNRAGVITKTYTFEGVWPTTIGNIDLSAETNDAIETFDVTLRYNYWTATKPSDGTGAHSASTTT